MNKPEFKGVLDAAYVDAVFEYIVNSEFPTYSSKRGRRSNRFQKVREVFRGRETERIPLQELAAVFSNTKPPQQSVCVAIYDINKAFAKYDIPLEIEGLTRSGRCPHSTTYRLHIYQGEC